jgi:Trk K+ transport system NAD-binding subunit
MYEMSISPKWDGMTVAALLNDCSGTICAALTRAGRAELPSPEMKLKSGDLLTVSATLAGIKSLRERLQEGMEA